MSVRPLACWDCGLESHLRHTCLSHLIVAVCEVKVSATGRSLVQRIATECGVFKAVNTRGYFTRYSPASSIAS